METLSDANISSSCSSARRSMTISLQESTDNTVMDDFSSEELYISDEQPWDTSDEYDTDLDLPIGARSPIQETPNKDPLDIICQETYRKSCKHTFPQKRIEGGLAERNLQLKYRSLGCEAVKPLARALANNLRIERLDLQYADMEAEGARDLATALAENVTVSYLNLGNNSLGTEGVKWVAYLLMKNKLIKHLSLEGNKLTDNAAPHLALAIEHNTSLSILDLSHNEFCENGPKVMAAALGLNTGLETFRISWNHVRGKGAVALCQSLKYNESLKLLDVSMNGFGYEGSLAMTEALKVNNTLRELNMSNNRISWKGALLLSAGLKVNQGLEILRLGRNPLTTTGCMDITEAVASPDCKVKVLDLTDIPVLIENEVLVDAIKMRKDFRFTHGGIVITPDVLGERKARKKDHMEIVMEYLKAACIRPMEMLRDYDKSVNFAVSQEHFVDRLARTNIPLHKFEMRALAKAIAENQDVDGLEKIDYFKLVESVTDQIIRDRVRVKKEKFLVRKTKQHHKKILASGLPEVPVERSNGKNSKTPRGSSSPGAINFSNLDLGTLSFTSLPSLPEDRKGDNFAMPLNSSRIFVEDKMAPSKTIAKPKLVSMTAPLGEQGRKKKRVKKITRKKKKKSKTIDCDHVETLVSKSKK